jgi:hypothetical protein
MKYGAMSVMTLMRCLTLTLCGAGAWVTAAQDGGEAVTGTVASVTTSASGRFMVTGPNAVKTSEYTRWAEAMAERLERRLGMPPAFSRQAPLRILLTPAGSDMPGLTVECQYRAGRLYGSLTLNEYVLLDYEELLAAWCRLALVSIVDHRRDPRLAAREPPRVPQWLAVGLAQTLDPALCARNRRLVYGATPELGQPEVSKVLSWDSLPERWHRTRALCGMTAMWIDSLKPQGESWRLIIDRLATGEMPTAGWVAMTLAGVEPGAACEAAWSRWLKRQERVVQDMGSVSSVTLNQLREMVEVSTSELGDTMPDEFNVRLTPRDLVARRSSPAVRLIAEERMQQVQALTIGKAPELVQAGQAYALFFESLVRGARAWTLRRRLRDAEEVLATLSDLTRAREAYVDAFEREAALTSGNRLPMSSAPALDKDPLEAYVDEVEQRFVREEAGAARREGSIRNDHGSETDAQNNRRGH